MARALVKAGSWDEAIAGLAMHELKKSTEEIFSEVAFKKESFPKAPTDLPEPTKALL